MSFLPDREFRRCVARYGGDARPRGFSCWDQYLSMAFAQLTYRDGLRDIEACLRSLGGKLYHLGFRGRVARSTLADANDAHDWRIYADFAQVLIRMARPLYASDPIGVELDQSLYALDSTTIDLCLSLFPWAKFRKRKAAVKMHTLLDLHGNIPTFISITDGKVHDVNILDEILPEAGAFYVMDRGYVDFERLYLFTLSAAFFVVRTKSNVLIQRRYSHPVDKTSGVRSDHTVILTAFETAQVYPDALRRVHYLDGATSKRFRFLTNNFALPALTNRPDLQGTLAGGTVLSVDQAAPAHQGFLWHQRECREDADLDRGVGLCAGRHRSQAAGPGVESLPNPTDSERDPFRENAHFTGPSALRLPRELTRFRQPVALFDL